MKSIFRQNVYRVEYYLGFEIFSGFCIDRKKILDVFNEKNIEGKIETTSEFIETKTVWETESIHRELELGDKVLINDEEFLIKEVIHSVNGDLVYILEEEIYIEDEESKEKAEEDYALRQVFLKGFIKGRDVGYKACLENHKKNEEKEVTVKTEPEKKRRFWFK